MALRRVFVLVCLALVASPALAAIRFSEVGANAGVRLTHDPLGYVEDGYFDFQNHSGPGAAFADLNRDGWLDLIVADGFQRGQGASAGTHVFLNNGDGSFVDASAWYGSHTSRVANVVLAADVNNDGYGDLLITNHFEDPSLLNGNRMRASDVSGNWGLPYLFYSQSTKPNDYKGPRSTGAALADYDNDGYLDFYLVNQTTLPDRLVHNVDGGFFQATLKVNPDKPGTGFQVVWLDYDQDGDQDAFVVNDVKEDFLFQNQGPPNWDFIDVAPTVKIEGGYQYNDNKTMGMGCAVGDFDNDLDEDVYITNFRLNTLFQNPGDWQAGGRRTFAEVAAAKGVDHDWNGWGCDFFDADNDGDLDLYLVNGWVEGALEPRQRDTYLNPNVFYRNDGGPDYSFTDISEAAGVDEPDVGRGLTVGDYDRDGDLDMYVTNNTYYDDRQNPYVDLLFTGTHHLYRNDSDSGNHWINLKLQGAGVHGGGKGCNRDAIGVRVIATTAAGSQLRVVRAGSGYMGMMSLEVEFGLGAANQVDELRVEWNCGDVATYQNLAADHFYRVIEGVGVEDADIAFESIQCAPTTQGMRISWVSQASMGVQGAEIYRRPSGDGAFARLEVDATPDGSSWMSYDPDAVVGESYDYRILLILEDGGTRASVPITARMEKATPARILLLPNVPNPFNPSTSIRFELPSEQRVRLLLRDARGRRIKDVADRVFPAGLNEFQLELYDHAGQDLASGVYYLSLVTQEGSQTRKISLVR